jgi:hypothetical protein
MFRELAGETGLGSVWAGVPNVVFHCLVAMLVKRFEELRCKKKGGEKKEGKKKNPAKIRNEKTKRKIRDAG